jgi:hypothetical protein
VATVVPSSWSVRHFSQASPQCHGHDDVPALLRRLADSIERLGPVEVHDIGFHDEVNADSNW